MAKALGLDINQQQNFVRFFRNLPEKPSTTIRFFNHVEYYCLHSDDANLAADFFGSIPLKYMGLEPQLSYVCVNKSNFEHFIRELLLVRQYRVEVYCKVNQNRNNEWQVEYRGSPGNLTQFEEILYGNGVVSSNSVFAVKIIKGGVAVASVNTVEAKFEVCEMRDNDCLSEFEALLAQLGPKECILPTTDSADYKLLKEILQRNGILTASVKNSDFSSSDIVQDLNRLLLFHDSQQRNAESIRETDLTDAMACLQAVIKFLDLLGDETNFNQFKLSTLDVHRFVRVDNAALYALNALPKAGDESPQVFRASSSKSFHLLGVLDSCVTVQGRRLLEQWIKQPLKDINLINERLDVVECFVKNAEVRMVLTKDSLPRMSDLTVLAKKLASKKCKLQDAYRVYQTVHSLPRFVSNLQGLENKTVNAVIIQPVNDICNDLEKYQTLIEHILDFNLVDRGEYFVKNTVNDELNELYKKKQRLEEKMQRQLDCAAEDLGLIVGKTIKLECNDQWGYFFRITKKEEPVLRRNKAYTILNVIQGGVRFRNSKLTDLNEQYSTIKEEYEQEQKSVVTEVMEVAAGYADSLRNLNTLLATVDVLLSFASVAVSAKIPYVRPKMHKLGSGILKLMKVRHPCVEQQDTVAYIPNDLELNRDGYTFYTITGPNMCGKSTYIRSIGVCVLMAHLGSMVPCSEAEISIVDGILARVGANDCQLKGLSTFMLEMLEMSTIIESATENSLVIIDELGRGTSTFDGYGIAWAIAKYLVHDLKAFTLFATHFHEIVHLADSEPNLKNLHVTALVTNNSITPLFNICEGECDKSYGIHCARVAGFPEDVLEWAEDHQKQLEHYNNLQQLSETSGVSRKRILEEGEEAVKKYVKKLQDANLEEMPEEEARKIIKQFKDEIEQSDNLFIKHLLSQ